MEARRAAAEEYPEREGQYVCQYYMRTGMCKFGASCKYHHPRQRGESPSLVMPNIHGYPLRPNEKECLHYMKTRQCKFGMTCKFHHPQPTDAQVLASAVAPFPLPEAVLPPTTYPAVQSPSVDSAEQYEMLATGKLILLSSALPNYSVWRWTKSSLSSYTTICFCTCLHRNPVYHRTQLYASAPAYTGPHMFVISSIGASSSTHNESTFPHRPGQPECHYYMKYGDYKFGSSCKYHHPAEWSGTNAYLFRAMDLPHDLGTRSRYPLGAHRINPISYAIACKLHRRGLCIYPFSFFHVPAIFTQRGRESIQ